MQEVKVGKGSAEEPRVDVGAVNYKHINMKTSYVKERIKELQLELTGDLLKDSEIQQEIYSLKKEILEWDEDYVSIEQIDDEFDEGCLYCGG